MSHGLSSAPARRTAFLGSARRGPTGQPQRLGARLRRRARDPKGIALNIIPLVDVTFILMIFFVVAGSFDAWEGVLGSRLFRSGGVSGVPLPYTPVVVRLTRSTAAGEGVSIKVESIDKSPANVAELGDILAELRQRPGFGPEVPVVVIGDDDVAWEHVAGVWNAAVRAGFPHLAIGKQPRKLTP